MKRGFMDNGPYPPLYPIRGIKNADNEWELAALTFDEIEECKTDFFYQAYDLYANYLTFGGTPNGRGWNRERRTVLEIIKLLKSEEGAFDSWEMEKENRSKKNGG